MEIRIPLDKIKTTERELVRDLQKLIRKYHIIEGFDIRLKGNKYIKMGSLNEN